MERTITIGNDPANTVVVADPRVSGRHASLTLTDKGDVILQDLGSCNGTYVNGRRITRTPLRSNDKVCLGPCAFAWDDCKQALSNMDSKLKARRASWLTQLRKRLLPAR